MAIGAGWRKSAASMEGECVEVRRFDGAVVVRHSQNPDGASLHFTDGEWRAFLVGARRGEFDLPDDSPAV